MSNLHLSFSQAIEDEIADQHVALEFFPDA